MVDESTHYYIHGFPLLQDPITINLIKSFKTYIYINKYIIKALILDLFSRVKKMFACAGLELTKEGYLSDFLGVNIDRKADSTIYLMQPQLIDQISKLTSAMINKVLVWKMFYCWFSAQIFAWTMMIIEYPMIGFLAMLYFLVHALNAQIISKLFSGYALIIIE